MTEENEWKNKAVKRLTELQIENQNIKYQLTEKDKQIEELQEQIENLKIMLQAEREVRCNEEYLKKITELEEGYNYNEKKLFKAKKLLTDFYCAIPSSFAECFKDILERTKEFIIKE